MFLIPATVKNYSSPTLSSRADHKQLLLSSLQYAGTADLIFLLPLWGLYY